MVINVDSHTIKMGRNQILRRCVSISKTEIVVTVPGADIHTRRREQLEALGRDNEMVKVRLFVKVT